MTKGALFGFLVFMVFTNLLQKDNVKKFFLIFCLKISEEMPCAVMSCSSLKLDIIGIFAPQELTDSTNQEFYLERQLLKL